MFHKDSRVFPWRLTSKAIFNNRLLFKKKDYCFLEIFVEDKAVMGGGQNLREIPFGKP